MSKSKKLLVDFPWHSAETVTGSAVLIKSDKRTILVEFGLNQEAHTLLEDYRTNSKRLSFKPSELDYIVVLHCHIDHIGLIPRLYKEGASCPLIAPIGNKKIFEIMLRDCAHILKKNIEEINEKYEKNLAPIYTNEDVDTALFYYEEYSFTERQVLDEFTQIQFLSSAHIKDSAQCKLWVTNYNRVSCIGITSDLGNVAVSPQLYTSPFEPIQKCNLLIAESTYGGEKKHKATQADREKDREKLATIVDQICIDNGGKILIPVFALQRAQAILTTLLDLNITVPILLDSPLMLRINKVFSEDFPEFQKLLEKPNVFPLSEFAQTEAWLYGDKPCIFLSCSGMMTAGRSVHVAKHILSNARNAIVFCGYSVENSLATRIKCKKTKTLKIEGKKIPCRAHVMSLHSFTSHMQKESLIQYIGNCVCDKVILVHGSEESKISLQKDLQDYISKKNRTTRVSCGTKGMHLLL